MNENTSENLNVNREHKDSVFSLLFSNPDVLRELYSAIEGINLPPDIPIDINTLSNVLIRERINDISFTIDNRLVVLIEHQSTVNSNMPLRLLMYIARIYEKIINRKKTYQKKLEKIPYPEFIVLYNGDKPHPDHKELRLSEAFKNAKDLKGKNKELPLELIVQVYNINMGHNEEILKKSETLDNYSSFIDKIRDYQKEDFSLAEAVESAIEYCIDNNKLKNFLEKHGSEVRNMLITEYNRDEEMEVVREEGREEGIITTARNALAKGSTPDFVQEITGLDMAVIEQLAENN
ncbi:MAG: Rpn family recombination-promoting nuclease/putative transposase [Treponema sp.]|jgi:predicted transposase/invertase (TIGR01784 family)|nr:Rpn family recombination-promoting nuclease/putative transposase [Treponema sp.]